jgi:membrane protease YdiL (CAAX protease family)
MLAPVVASIIVAVPLAIILILIGLEDFGMETLLGSGQGMATLLIVSFSPIFLLVWLWLYVFERRHLWTVGLEAAAWLVKYLRGAFWGLLMIAAALAIPALLGFIRYEGGGPGLLAALTSALIVLPGWIVQGAAEEVLFRGFLLQIIGSRWGVRLAVLLPALLFALLHIFNQNIGIIAFTNLFLFGVFTSLYALRDGSLWGIFALHSAWNWAQSNLFGIQVSGIPVRMGALLDLTETGPDWLTGGQFGIEGGVAVTLVLLVGIAFVLGQRWRVSVDFEG